MQVRDKEAEPRGFPGPLPHRNHVQACQTSLGSPTVVSGHRIRAQQDFTFGYNRLRVRAKSAALRPGRGSARVAHQGGH